MKKALTLTVAMLAGMVLFIGSAAAESPAESVIGTMLDGYHMTYQMTTEDLIADNGASFNLDDPENHRVLISTSDEGVSFQAEGMSNPQIAFGQQLDVEGTMDHKQAVHVKFKPSGKNFSFSLWAGFGLWINIGDQNEPYLSLLEKNYQEPFEGDFRVEPGSWHHLLSAITPEGILQAAMWKDGEEDKAAYLNLDLFQSFNEANYQAIAWELCVNTAEQEAITLNSYEYYTFEEFVTEGKVIEAQDGSWNHYANGGAFQDPNDYGPDWTINVADNYVTDNNSIFQQVSPQMVTIANGDEYIGFVLKDLLDISGNGSMAATIWFNHDGENNLLAEPTYDAYIVCVKNGEFMGGPYLITIDGVSKDPVTDIYP
jgi:hypothetical protein